MRDRLESVITQNLENFDSSKNSSSSFDLNTSEMLDLAFFASDLSDILQNDYSDILDPNVVEDLKRVSLCDLKKIDFCTRGVVF